MRRVSAAGVSLIEVCRDDEKGIRRDEIVRGF